MVDCDKCGKSEDIPFKCKYCGSSFCSECRLPEDHDCPGLKTFEENKKNWQKAVKSVNKPFKSHFKKKSHKHRSKRKNFHHKPKIERHVKKPNRFKTKIFYWLKKRTHRKYNFPRVKDHLFKIAVGLIFSIFFVILFAKKAVNLNDANLWIFNLGGCLLITSCIFLIKYSFKTFGEIGNLFKRQRRWIKIIVYVVIMILIWQAFTNNNFIVNPMKNAFEGKDFSKLSPLNLSGVNFSSSSEETDQTVSSNKGIFSKDYSSYKTNPKTVKLYGLGDFVVFQGVNDYLARQDRSISYYYTPPTTKDFIMKDLDDDVQKLYLDPLVDHIKAKSNIPNEQARIAINLVQSIPYDWSAFNEGNVEGRYPYEVLYDMEGVCMEKADLMTYLLRGLGFGVAIFEFEAEGHRAVGLKCSKGNYGSDYCFVEATDFYAIGKIPIEYVGGVDIRGATPELVIISEGRIY